VTTPSTLPDRAPVDAYLDAVAQYGQQVADALNAAQATITDLQGKLDAAQAAQSAQEGDSVQVAEIAGFGQHGGRWGLALTPVVEGSARDLDVRRLTAHSSRYTPASVPKSTATPPTNLLFLAWSGSTSRANPVAGVDLSGFTLEGSDQGHEYNGLGVFYAPAALLRDLALRSCSYGSTSAPPHETFDLDVTGCDGARLIGLDVVGGPSAASVLGVNNQTGVYVTGGRYTGAVHGMGATFWKTVGAELVDVDLSGNRKPLNFENCTGQIRIVRCDLRGKTHRDHASIDGNIGSAKVTIVDPQVDAWPLRVFIAAGGTYQGKPQLQKVSDVQLWVDGKDVSADPKFLTIGAIG
jgi:hypothetical protein